MPTTPSRWFQTTPAPMPTAAITPRPAEGFTITQYEALQNDILIAVQQAEGLVFDYRDPKGERLARSYLYKLRLLKGRIETARKDAKAYALEYGKQVDRRAKDMTGEIVALISPHQEALDAIAQEEAQRVAQHQAVIGRIINLRRTDDLPDPFHVETLERNLALARGIKIDAQLEEFQNEAQTEQDATVAALTAAIDHARQVQADRAEAQRLEAERAEAQREADRKAGAEQERARAAAQAERAAQALQAAEREREAQAQRATEAEAQLEAQRQQQQEAEARAAAKRAAARERLIFELLEALARKSPSEAAEAIADGTLHPAVQVNWGADW
jgi:hypothetical protein